MRRWPCALALVALWLAGCGPKNSRVVVGAYTLDPEFAHAYFCDDHTAIDLSADPRLFERLSLEIRVPGAALGDFPVTEWGDTTVVFTHSILHTDYESRGTFGAVSVDSIVKPQSVTGRYDVRMHTGDHIIGTFAADAGPQGYCGSLY